MTSFPPSLHYLHSSTEKNFSSRRRIRNCAQLGCLIPNKIIPKEYSHSLKLHTHPSHTQTPCTRSLLVPKFPFFPSLWLFSWCINSKLFSLWLCKFHGQSQPQLEFGNLEESCAPAALTPPGQIPLTNPFVSRFSRCQRLSLPAADAQGAVPCPRAPPNLGINPVAKPSSALGSHQQSPTATILIPTLKRTPELPPLRDFPYQEIFQPAENLHAASWEAPLLFLESRSSSVSSPCS